AETVATNRRFHPATLHGARFFRASPRGEGEKACPIFNLDRLSPQSKDLLPRRPTVTHIVTHSFCGYHRYNYVSVVFCEACSFLSRFSNDFSSAENLASARVPDRLPDALRRGRHVEVRNADSAQRIGDRVHHRGHRAGAAGFAAAFR